jgi:hypothetical protein
MFFFIFTNFFLSIFCLGYVQTEEWINYFFIYLFKDMATYSSFYLSVSLSLSFSLPLTVAHTNTLSPLMIQYTLLCSTDVCVW